MTQKKKSSTPDSLIKSSKPTAVELTEQSLEQVSAGVRKAGEKPVEYLKVELTTG